MRRRRRGNVAILLDALPWWGRIAVGVTVAVVICLVWRQVLYLAGGYLLIRMHVEMIGDKQRREDRNRRAIRRRYDRRPL